MHAQASLPLMMDVALGLATYKKAGVYSTTTAWSKKRNDTTLRRRSCATVACTGEVKQTGGIEAPLCHSHAAGTFSINRDQKSADNALTGKSHARTLPLQKEKECSPVLAIGDNMAEKDGLPVCGTG